MLRAITFLRTAMILAALVVAAIPAHADTITNADITVLPGTPTQLIFGPDPPTYYSVLLQQCVSNCNPEFESLYRVFEYDGPCNSTCGLDFFPTGYESVASEVGLGPLPDLTPFFEANIPGYGVPEASSGAMLLCGLILGIYLRPKALRSGA